MNHENKQEYIEIDDFVRQGDYKYTYSDSSNTALKSEQADLVVTAIEKFAQLIPLNIQEIFTWYFEQKGVDNPERFLGVGVNEGINGVSQSAPSPLTPLPQGEGNGLNPENQPAQYNLPPQGLPPQGFDLNTLALILSLLQQVKKEKGNRAKPKDFINILESVLENTNKQEEK